MASAGISVCFGMVAGFALSIGMSRIISTRVANSTNQPLIVTSVSILLLIIAVVACLVPAYRALHIDPTTALRSE